MGLFDWTGPSNTGCITSFSRLENDVENVHEITNFIGTLMVQSIVVVIYTFLANVFLSENDK
jgi:hypothetical protein